jgi:hypothetical protein
MSDDAKSGAGSSARTGERSPAPVPMLLFCPRCRMQHVDKPDPASGWTNPPHATHTCAYCQLLWRPSNVNTVGVLTIEALEPKHVDRIQASFPGAHT